MAKYPVLQTGSFHYASDASADDRFTLIEYYVDYTCPFSKKIFATLTELYTSFTAENNVKFQMHQLPQVWHPQSTLVHEAALAVRELYKDKTYFEFSARVFEKQTEFFDDNCWNKSRDQIYKELADIAKDCGCNAEQVLNLLKPNLDEKKKGHLNYGNAVTKELKGIVKFHRKRGVHVTPTVFVNGIEATEVSSGWTVQQWKDFLAAYNVKTKL